MPTYDINVTRDGRWWMIEIPDLDGLTQAEDFDEIEVMARDYIAVSTDTPIDEIGVRIVGNTEALPRFTVLPCGKVLAHEGRPVQATALRSERWPVRHFIAESASPR